MPEEAPVTSTWAAADRGGEGAGPIEFGVELALPEVPQTGRVVLQGRHRDGGPRERRLRLGRLEAAGEGQVAQQLLGNAEVGEQPPRGLADHRQPHRRRHAAGGQSRQDPVVDLAARGWARPLRERTR